MSPPARCTGSCECAQFTQDDAHIFCTEQQITAETVRFVELLSSIYRDFGFPEFSVKFSDRPALRVGSDPVWDHAENALKEACATAGVDYTLNPGEGAFYGPKLEFVLRDAIGRDWQCGTLQVDFNMPERLDAEYVGEDGARHTPVMLHRAIMGSFERFLGVVIEHYAGRFPLWLAPVQAVVATIVSDADAYAGEVAAALRQAGLAVETGPLEPEDQRQGARAQLGACAGAGGGRAQGGGEPDRGAPPAGRIRAGGGSAGRGGAASCARGHATRSQSVRKGALCGEPAPGQSSVTTA